MRGVSAGCVGELTNFVLAVQAKHDSGFPSLAHGTRHGTQQYRLEERLAHLQFACSHGQGRQGLGRRKHAMVTVPGHTFSLRLSWKGHEAVGWQCMRSVGKRWSAPTS